MKVYCLHCGGENVSTVGGYCKHCHRRDCTWPYRLYTKEEMDQFAIGFARWLSLNDWEHSGQGNNWVRFVNNKLESKNDEQLIEQYNESYETKVCERQN